MVAGQVRGAHLTSIVSKTVERLIVKILDCFLSTTNAYTDGQWAFRPNRSCRDLVVLLVCSWIGLADTFKIGLFLSDISGAFDKLDTDIFIVKCKRAGLHQTCCGSSILLCPGAKEVLEGHRHFKPNIARDNAWATNVEHLLCRCCFGCFQ